MIQLSHFTPNLLDDPYNSYKFLRSISPIFIESDADLNTKGIWIFSRYNDAKEIFDLNNSISKNISNVRDIKTPSIFDLNMLNMDGQEHIKSRRLVREFFSSRYLDNFKFKIEGIIDECILDISNKSQFDLVEDFAEIIPVKTILTLIGLPIEDASKIRKWSIDLSPSLDSFLLQTPELNNSKITVLKEIHEYINFQLNEPDSIPDGSLLKYLFDHSKTANFDLSNVIGETILLLFAGHETTISLIGSSLYLLLNNPNQLSLLCKNKNLIPDAIEEALRYESPAQRSTFRVALDPIEVGGQLILPGQQLSIFLGSANRDELIFEDPDLFNIKRPKIRHFAFGAGSHMCLGQMLARIETTLAIQKISLLLPKLELISTIPQWRQNTFFRQLNSLPVTFKN